MSSYLSIDIDYWNGARPESLYRSLDNLLREIKKRRPPEGIIAVMNHQQLVRHVNDSSARCLLNVDQHSDLIKPQYCRSLHCGNWVNYVKWRNEGQYIWLHRHDLVYGECSGMKIFNRGETNLELVDWARVDHQYVSHLPAFVSLTRGIRGAGLVMSPAYSDPGFPEVFKDLVEKYRIRYFKGVSHETNSRKGRP